VVTAITMPLYSIATGIGAGGKVAQALPAVLGLAGLFAVKYAVAG